MASSHTQPLCTRCGGNPLLLLGLEPHEVDDPKRIQEAFRQAAKALHPDVSGYDSEAHMRQLIWARDELLRNPAQYRPWDGPRRRKPRGAVEDNLTPEQRRAARRQQPEQ